MPLRPTPYPDVNEALRELLAQAQTILGPHLVGMYLSGSLALGDFAPHASDLDLVIVTDVPVCDDLFAALRDMHARFAAGGSPWAEKLEAVYVPEQALCRDAPTGAKYPVLEKRRALVCSALTKRSSGAAPTGTCLAGCASSFYHDQWRRVWRVPDDR